MRSGNTPEIQRALVLQGGGALGAYEVGVLSVLFDSLTEEDTKKEGPLFDIVAGTSIGAMNAAVLISNVVKSSHMYFTKLNNTTEIAIIFPV